MFVPFRVGPRIQESHTLEFSGRWKISIRRSGQFSWRVRWYFVVCLSATHFFPSEIGRKEVGGVPFSTKLSQRRFYLSAEIFPIRLGPVCAVSCIVRPDAFAFQPSPKAAHELVVVCAVLGMATKEFPFIPLGFIQAVIGVED